MLKYLGIPVAVAVGVGYPHHQDADFAIVATGVEQPGGAEPHTYEVISELRKIRVVKRSVAGGTPNHVPARPSQNAFPVQGELAGLGMRFDTGASEPTAEPVLCLTPAQWQQHGKHYRVDITVREMSGERTQRPKRSKRLSHRSKKSRKSQNKIHLPRREGRSPTAPRKVPQGLSDYPQGLRLK